LSIFEYFVLYKMARDNDVVMAYSRYSLCVCLEGLRKTKQPLNCFFFLMLTLQDWRVSLSILHCTHRCTLRLNLNEINIYVLFTEYICSSPMLHFEIVFVHLKQISCHILKDRKGEVPLHAMKVYWGDLKYSSTHS